jgi:hypothetical protein
LPIVRPAHFDAGNFGQRIGTVGRLERPCEQILFADGLRAIAGIDATRAEKEQALDTVAISGVNDVGLNLKIVANEIRRMSVVGLNAADFGCSQKDLLGTLGGKNASTAAGCFRSSSAWVRKTKLLKPWRSRLRTSAEPASPRCPAT